MIERCSELARLMADELSSAKGVRMLNEVALNQVLFAIDGDDGTLTGRKRSPGCRRMAPAGSRGPDGETPPAIRVSISNWSTTEHDVTRSAEVIRSAISSARNSVGASA